MRRVSLNIAVGLAMCGLAALPAQTARAGVVAESENFILRGDLRKGDAKTLVRDLEAFRADILRIAGTRGAAEVNKVRVYTVGSAERLTELTGRRNVAGIYTITRDGPVFLLNTESGFRRSAGRQTVGTNLKKGADRDSHAARRIAYHEYAHHLLAAYTDSHYPRWYNEGFAELMASYDNEGKGFTLGQGTRNQAMWLEHANWIPIETVLKSVHAYPFANGSNAQGAFYAQSWLMVHYLQNTPGMPARANAYFEALNRGEDPLESFATVFELSPAEFEADLKDYFRAGRLNVSRFDTEVSAKSIDVDVREVVDANEALWAAQAVSVLGGGGDAGRARRASEIAAATTVLGRTADVILLEAAQARAADDHAGAIRLASEAVALAPDDLDALRALGRAEVEGSREASIGSADAGRASLRRVLSAKPDDPAANYYLGLTYAGHGPGAPAEAVMAAGRALNHYRDLSFSQGNLQLVPMLIANGETSFVRPMLKDVAAWAESASARRYARELLAQIGA